MHDYGVVPQSIPPLLTQSGSLFEEKVERTVAARFRTIDLALRVPVADGIDVPDSRPTDNERVVAETRALAAGETLVLFQPRLLVALGGWDVRGDIDILRLARDASGALQILIADIKSSTAAKVEHRLQVAFYAEMVAALLAEAGIAVDRRVQIDLGILYRGPTDDARPATASDRERRELERARARDLLGVEDGLLELIVERCRGLPRLGAGPGHRRAFDRAPRDGRAVRGHPLPPDLQVRRLPLQRVLHEVERRDATTCRSCRT